MVSEIIFGFYKDQGFYLLLVFQFERTELKMLKKINKGKQFSFDHSATANRKKQRTKRLLNILKLKISLKS